MRLTDISLWKTSPNKLRSKSTTPATSKQELFVTVVNAVKYCHKKIYYRCCRGPRYTSENSYYEKFKKEQLPGGNLPGGIFPAGNFLGGFFPGDFFSQGHFSGHRIILLFNNATFMIHSMVILTFILCSNFSTPGFKFKRGLYVIIYQLSLVKRWVEWLLRMIPRVCLFTNVHEINQQHKLKPKIIFDSSF